MVLLIKNFKNIKYNNYKNNIKFICLQFSLFNDDDNHYLFFKKL